MTEPADKSAAEFYDSLSPDYDMMTGFEKRLAQEESTFRELVHQFRISTAIDAGCGTGLHSCVLARLGVAVTGVDVSGEMLRLASARAEELGLKVRFVASTFQSMSAIMKTTVDAVFCMGNSLVHLASRRDVLEALRSFYAVLKPEGVLLIQILNYDRIMSSKARVQSVKQEEGRIFIRFYDFEEDRIRFNILTLWRTPQGFQHHLDSTYLRPMGHAELGDSIAAAGFQNTRTFGSSRMDKFDPGKSVDLFAVAMK